MTNLYAINDALSTLAQDAGVELSDDVLDELTHHVGRTLRLPEALGPIDDYQPTHLVSIPGSVAVLAFAANDPQDGEDVMLQAAAVGQSALSGRVVTVTDLATGATEDYDSQACEEWWA